MNEPQDEYGALVANWNGADIVERCLKSVLAAARRAQPPIKVTVVDDDSDDGSADLIERRFPEARLIRLDKNVGFGRAVNRAVAALDTPWVFLLNNDLVLPADYFQSLIAAKAALDSGALFAIGSRTLAWGSQESNHAGMRAGWRRAMISQVPFETNRLEKTDFVQMGSCLVHREKFVRMDGFAEIYSPGYWEDYDLCYQARRRGWDNYYEPRAYAYHWGKHSMAARLGDDGLALIIKRNHLLFNWVNLDDRGLLIKHLAGLGPLALSPDVEDGVSSVGWGRALLAALALLPEALRLRRRRRDNASVADREILFAAEE